MRAFFLISSVFFITWLLNACQQESDTFKKAEITLPDEGIAVENAWARPGSENGVSAVYFRLANGSAGTDTLVNISTSVAGIVELHETFQLENDMLGMRKAENPVISGRSAISLRPGGLHIMLMQLSQPLKAGDEFEVRLEFSMAGEKIITVPVQSGE